MMDNVPKEITPRINAKVKVCALCTSLNVIDIYMKFYEDILNSLQVRVQL